MDQHSNAGRDAVKRWALLLTVCALCNVLGCGARSSLFLGSGGNAGTSSAMGGNSNGGAGSSPDGGNRACGLLIDDMEDGTGRICTGEGRVGAWYAFNDDTGTQWPLKTPAGAPLETSLISGSRGASLRALHTNGTAFGLWGAGIGFDLNFDGTTYRHYDARRYAGISFWARGQAGQTITFRVSSESNTAAIYGGTCVPKCSGPGGLRLQVGPTWIKYVVPFSEPGLVSDGVLRELDRLTNVQFMVREAPFDFWVDDVSFFESASGCCPNLPNCQGGIRFKDPALAAAVLASIAPAATLECSAVCSLHSLSAMGLGIRDLDGLECLSQLTTLRLTNNEIVDLTPLSEMPGLVELNLEKNRVYNASPLRGLTNLSSLNLAGNQLDRATGLASLVGLNTLSLSDNKLFDVRDLASLVQLQSLSLSNNALGRVSDLATLVQLRSLALAGDALQSVAALSGLTELTQLDLSHNELSTMNDLAGLVKLEGLDLSDNSISDISEVSVRSKLTRLSGLNLARNQIQAPGSLSAFSSLTSLDLSGNRIHSLGPDFSPRSVRILNLANNELSQIDWSSGLSFLNLDLSNNALSGLAGLSQVHFVNLIACGRCGLTPGTFTLSNNPITDLTELLAASFESSFIVDLSNDPGIVCADQELNIRALRARGVTVTSACP